MGIAGAAQPALSVVEGDFTIGGGGHPVLLDLDLAGVD